jgi:NiFe hydrogenase small subunit HydA
MNLSRRDFVKAAAAVAAALGLGDGLAPGRSAVFAREGGPGVVWLQAQGCSGCTSSFLSSITYARAADLLADGLDLAFHGDLGAAAGQTAVDAAEAAYSRGGYILVVEGAIPTAFRGKACRLWPGLTALAGVKRYAARARAVLAVGTCAAFGGMSAAGPNPTGARGVGEIVGTGKLINIPGCPAHPDWVVGTIAYLLKYNRAPALDALRRPAEYFGKTVHEACPLKADRPARWLGDDGCLACMGCRGEKTHADCPTRRWNADTPGAAGVNWCVGGRAPCVGCTEPNFPDAFAPFLTQAATADPPAPDKKPASDDPPASERSPASEARVEPRPARPREEAQSADAPNDRRRAATARARDAPAAGMDRDQLELERLRREAEEQAARERIRDALKRQGKTPDPVEESRWHEPSNWAR